MSKAVPSAHQSGPSVPPVTPAQEVQGRVDEPVAPKRSGRPGRPEPLGPPAPGVGLRHSDYWRRPEVEAEIAALPACADPGFWQAVEASRAVETVVHAIRRCLRAGDLTLTRQLETLLPTRIGRLVATVAYSRLPCSEAAREDLQSELAEVVVRQVRNLSGTKSAEFWEVHFQHALRQAAKTATRKLLSQWERSSDDDNSSQEDGAVSAWDRRSRTVVPIGSGGEEERGFAEDQLAGAGDLADEITDALSIQDILGRLEGNVRTAVHLRYLGYQDKSNDPDEPTITGTLGVTDRTLRNYYKRARDVLRPVLRQQGMHVPDETRPVNTEA